MAAAPMLPGEDGTTLFLCGDVMLGRGIDQVLPHPGDPRLVEDYADTALTYVDLAERAHGPIPRGASDSYVWGDALEDLAQARPQARIVNLETAVTTSGRPWPKGINYRVSPRNAACLSDLRVDCCVLANNHVMDWGAEGLVETLGTLDRLGLARCGAGRDEEEACAPAVIGIEGGRRILVFAFGHPSSGIPVEWGATPHRPGVRLLPDLSSATLGQIARAIVSRREPGDLVVISIHWGSNWGYQVADEQRAAAHALVDAGACDILHGHSSHHPRTIEIYRDRLILYGCGDFINDYEGIGGHGAFRPELCLAYLPSLAADGSLVGFSLLPYRIRRFRLERAGPEEALWLVDRLSRDARGFRCRLAAGSSRRPCRIEFAQGRAS